MGKKYYICNGSGLIGRDGEIVQGLKNARRFKMSEAESFISKELDKDKYSKQVAFATGKKYVVMNATRFVGAQSMIVNDKALARQFRSAADAAAYIRSHKEIAKYLSDPVIVTEDLEAIETLPIKKFTEEQLKTLGISPEASVPTPRKQIRPAVKERVKEDSEHICALCGRPINDWDGTIDHIEPLSRGGKNSPSNLRYVHKSCNQAKGNFKDNEMHTKFTDIESKYIYDNPASIEAAMMMRAYLRGVLREYQQKGLT